MKCWNCGADLKDPAWGKLLFRETCENCHADLHCCFNCIYYKPGLPNDCAVPGTDYISDRGASNFCEEFKLSGKAPIKKTRNVDDAAKRLFGDVEGDGKPKDPKQRFHDLFGDEK